MKTFDIIEQTYLKNDLKGLPVKIIEASNKNIYLILVDNLLSTKNHPFIKYFINIRNQIIEDTI